MVATAEKVFFTTAEAVAALGISRSSAYNLMASGELTFVYFGTKRLIPAESLQAFAQRLREGTRVPA